MGERRVRRRTMSDLDRCAAILVDVHARDGYPVEGVADPHSRLQPEGLLDAWVAEVDGEVIGHIALTAPSPAHLTDLARLGVHWTGEGVVLLCRLFVDPEARGSGIGRDLVRAATTAAEAAGLTPVLDVMLKDTAAIRLYERLGWRSLGEAVHDDGAGGTPCRWYAWLPE